MSAADEQSRPERVVPCVLFAVIALLVFESTTVSANASSDSDQQSDIIQDLPKLFRSEKIHNTKAIEFKAQSLPSSNAVPAPEQTAAPKTDDVMRHFRDKFQAIMVLQMGRALIKQTKFADAATLFKDANIKDPSCADYISHYGLALRLMNRQDEAKQQLLKAVELDKNNSEGWLNLWLLYQTTGDAEAADNAYEQYLRLNPKLVDDAKSKAELEASDLLLRSLWVIGSNDCGSAAVLLKRACELNPSSFELNSIDGMVLTLTNQNDEARRHYQKAIELARDAIAANSNNATAWDALVISGLGTGDQKATTTAIQEVLSIAANGSDPSLKLEAQKVKEILVLLSGSETTIIAKVSKANCMNFQSLQQMAHGDYGTAAALLKQACELVPTWALTHADYGFALEKSGHINEAKIQFQEATKLDAQLASPWRSLGVLYQNSGEPKAAAKAFQEYLKLEPGAADAQQIRQAIDSLQTKSQQ